MSNSEESRLGSSRGEKETHHAASFLAKASSSLRRSPSKRHTPKTSNPMPVLDGVLLENALAKANVSSGRSGATQFRPGFKRAPSTPLDIHTVKYALSASSDETLRGPRSAVEATMIVAPVGNAVKKDAPPYVGRTASSMPAQEPNLATLHAPFFATGHPGAPIQSGSQTPVAIYQHIHDMASKRISTLDYIRKAHEGRVFWFNTVHFSRADLSRMPAFTPARLSRKATNYLLLGLSIPAVLDAHSPHTPSPVTPSAIFDFLRNFSSLLGEFESYQQIHPPDGSSTSSLSRARIPHMFKRATQATTGKGRRSGSGVGAEIGLPLQQSMSPPAVGPGTTTEDAPSHATKPSLDTTFSPTSIHSTTSGMTGSSPGSAISPPSTSFPSSYSSVPASSPHDSHPNSMLLPNEGPYVHLLTPPLPFAPDFFAVFATLCDVLIDAYQRILHIVSSPSVCTVAVGEVFAKTDARIRKVIIAGVIKDFESAARENGRREVLGVQKVVLGGLMGG